ncbi:uncharacterized protein A4U43_C04F23470 [Asparagus officinalis]|uniref:Uncharacterized protein n=1 Tax=Asparagus officinalis TaxID=4686 RepID=A0A5P1F8H3_ASPOF|nr:uncharacterized protein A4U43_C04F23470 [Asparagus officinalis]
MEEFDITCEAIGRFEPRYKAPSQYQFRVPLLKKACDRIEEGWRKQKQCANEDPCRSRRTLRRHATKARTDPKGSSSAAIDDMTDEGTNEDDLDENNNDDVEACSEQELDVNVRYEDDEED